MSGQVWSGSVRVRLVEFGLNMAQPQKHNEAYSN